MNTEFQALMREASQLTRNGDLRSATSAIQRSLGGYAPARSDHFTTDGPHTGPFNRAVNPHVVWEGMSSGPRDKPADVADGVPQDGRVTHAQFNHQGIPLEYRLFEPPGCTEPTPLVVMLHGCTQDADDFAVGTDMDSLARAAGVHVLYPTQSAARNARTCWNWFEPAHQQRDAGEVGALHALSEMIAGRPQIDASQIFVAGMSAGGAMALILAEQYPEKIAGVGVHSGLPSGVAQTLPQALSAMQGGRRLPVRAVASVNAAPVIVFHGSADNTVHPRNAEQIVSASLAHTRSKRSLHEGNHSGRAFKCYTYRTPEQKVACEHWELMGAGHQWSGGNSRGSHTDPTGPSASKEMLRFFLDIVQTTSCSGPSD